MEHAALFLLEDSPRLLVGVGGIGSGSFYALEGDHTLGRNESRPGRLLKVRDYCKLHIIVHYIATLLAAGEDKSGFRVVPIGKVGADAAGERLLSEMVAAGIDTRFVDSVMDAVTLHSVCFQYPDGSGGNITTSNGAAALLSCADVKRVRSLLAAADGRAVVLAAPEVPLEPRMELLKSGRETGAFNVAAFTSTEIEAAANEGFPRYVDLLALNEDEAAVCAGRPFAADDESFFRALLDRFLPFNSRLQVLVTAGPAGAWAFADGTWRHSDVVKVRSVSTAGAGDAFLGGVVSAMIAGVPLVDAQTDEGVKGVRRIASALDFGSMLASLSVTSPHTIHPDANLSRLKQFVADAGIIGDGRLAEIFT